MFVKNTMEAAGQDSELLLQCQGVNAGADNNLLFDQTLYKKKGKKSSKKSKIQSRSDSFATVKSSSEDSDLSDDSFVQRVSDKWGEQESEIRQAIFFQFTKPNTARTSNDLAYEEDKFNQYEKILDRHSLMSEDNRHMSDYYGGSQGSKSSSTFKLRRQPLNTEETGTFSSEE